MAATSSTYHAMIRQLGELVSPLAMTDGVLAMTTMFRGLTRLEAVYPAVTSTTMLTDLLLSMARCGWDGCFCLPADCVCSITPPVVINRPPVVINPPLVKEDCPPPPTFGL